jgi:hypothetical protein
MLAGSRGAQFSYAERKGRIRSIEWLKSARQAASTVCVNRKAAALASEQV